MTDAPRTPNRARSRAIRARMAETGESWTAAARHHDADQGRAIAQQPPAAEQIAERDWSRRARIRVIKERISRAPDDPLPAEGYMFRVGQELTMVQFGRAGRPVERDCWWTSFDPDIAAIIEAEKVEILEIIESDPPTFAEAALPAERVVELLGTGAHTWAEQGIFVIPSQEHREHFEVRAGDGELLGLVDIDDMDQWRAVGDRKPAQPLQYRAVITPGKYYPRSVPLPAGFLPPRPAHTADTALGERWNEKFRLGKIFCRDRSPARITGTRD